MDVQKYVDLATGLAIAYVPKVLLALIVLFVGLWVINRLSKLMRRGLEMRGVDVSLRGFLSSLVSIGLKVLLMFTVADMIGVQTTSFIAILGAAGLAVGLALQGSLGNFAGGVLILMFHPYKVGDVIEAQGQTGTVKEIQIFNTILSTADGRTVILPNGAVSNGTIINHTMAGALSFAIPIELDNSFTAEQVRRVLLPVAQADKRNTNPGVGIAKLGSGSTTFVVTGTTKPEDGPAVQGALLENLKTALAANGFHGPQAHTYVHNVGNGVTA